MSNRTIWKFKIQLEERFTLPLPEDFKVLKISDGFMWVEGTFTSTKISLSNKMFAIVGTGKIIPDGFQHVGTYFEGVYVWHVYKWEWEDC